MVWEMKECSKIIMHHLAKIIRIMKGYLFCNMCLMLQLKIIYLTCKDEVWHVDLGALNYKTIHSDLFRDMRSIEKLGFVEIGKDTPHPIVHVGTVQLSM